MNTTISIIIPAHNEQNYLEKTLESVTNQTYSEYEIIVVLNGCSDDSEKIVRKFRNVKLLSLSQCSKEV